MTRRPAPVSKGNPCSPLPKSGTHTSGVVTRKDKVPNVMTIASPAPTKPVFGEKMKSEMAEPGRPKDGAEAYATQYHALVEILNPILN